MTLTIKIKMDNAEFDREPGIEVAQMLKDYANAVEYGNLKDFDRRLIDSNGNSVGEAKVTR